MKKTTIHITGMHCGGCTATVQRILEQTTGVHGCSVSLETNQANVAHDPDIVSDEALVKAVTNAGYPASTTSQ